MASRLSVLSARTFYRFLTQELSKPTVCGVQRSSTSNLNAHTLSPPPVLASGIHSYSSQSIDRVLLTTANSTPARNFGNGLLGICSGVVGRRDTERLSSGSGLLHNHPTGLPVEQRRFYQAALKPRLICKGCYYVWRHGRKHVECSDHPRHKQMKRVAKRKMWKEDYSKGHWVRALDWHKVHHREAARNVDHLVMSHNWLAGKLGKEL